MEYYARPFSRVGARPVAILRESFPLTPETEEAVTPSVSRIGIGATVLPINRGVEGRRQRSTLDVDGGKGLVDFAQVFGRQPEIGGGQVVIQVFYFRRTRNWHDPRFLRQQTSSLRCAKTRETGYAAPRWISVSMSRATRSKNCGRTQAIISKSKDCPRIHVGDRG
jgi:hypothetical protein